MCLSKFNLVFIWEGGGEGLTERVSRQQKTGSVCQSTLTHVLQTSQTSSSVRQSTLFQTLHLKNRISVNCRRNTTFIIRNVMILGEKLHIPTGWPRCRPAQFKLVWRCCRLSSFAVWCFFMMHPSKVCSTQSDKGIVSVCCLRLKSSKKTTTTTKIADCK